jgi:hypothetical protein
VKKRLYKEAADVAAWPDAEVAAWRAARSMVVEGADIKPITRFDQGGAGCLLVLLLWKQCLVSLCFHIDIDVGSICFFFNCAAGLLTLW